MDSLGLSSTGIPERNSQAIFAKMNPSRSRDNLKKEHKSNERSSRNRADDSNGK